MLYTGKGDGGTTKVIDSRERISKDSPLPEALGALDELNALLGFVKVNAPAPLAAELHAVQENLFIVQAQTAGADKQLPEDALTRVEARLAAIEQNLPPITAFSISGGTERSALLDVARTFARRAERRVVAVARAGARAYPAASLAYLNRLSSLLFALSRQQNAEAGVDEAHPRY